MLEPVIVIEARSVVHLNKYRKLWITGWTVATLAMLGTAVQTTRLYEAKKNARDLQVLMVKVQKVQADQEVVNATYIKAWENQQATTNLLVTWGQYVKDRDDVVRLAKENKPVGSYAQYIKK